MFATQYDIADRKWSQSGFLRVDAWFSGDHYFEQVSSDRDEIEHELGDELVWHAPEEQKERRVFVQRECPAMLERDDWETQFEWLAEKILRFYEVFGPRFRSLEAPEGDA